MQSDNLNAMAETGILELTDRWLKAVQALDIDGIVAHYAADIIAYDAVSQLRFMGVDAYRKHWQACLAMCPGPMIFEIHDLNIVAGDEVAFGYSLIRCGGTSDSGEEKASWMRMTTGYRKIGRKWMIVHEHFSSPFDMESGKALFELKP
jgi:ketosteroid isomerase-like protein